MFRRLKKFGQKAARKIVKRQGKAIGIELGLVGNEEHVMKEIAGLLVKHGFLDVFLRIWDHCHNTDVEEEKYLYSHAYLTAKYICFNYSDASLDFCKEAYNHKTAVRRFMKELTLLEMAIHEITNDEMMYHLNASLSFLYNIVCLYDNNRYLIRENDGIQIIAKYRDYTSDDIKATAMFIVAYCINEDENDKIMAGDRDIKYMINMLDSAVGSEDHREKNGFTAQELVLGINKLAQNDTNKLSIVKVGILPHLRQMLGTEFSVEEKRSAVECLWTLSFHPDNRETIIKEPFLLDKVQRLAVDTRSDKSVKDSCEAILFNIKGKTSVVPENAASSTSESTKQHIMISYQWDVQGTILKLRTKLQESGYNVWLDVDRMQGSILAAMAEAVQNASIVLVAMTEKYKNSNPCRTESEYAYKLRKPIAPILLEPNYNPDGWLGALLGMKLYVDLCQDDWIQTELPKLLRMIQSNTNLRPVVENVTVVESASHEKPPLVDVPAKPDQSNRDVVDSPDKKRHQVVDWSKEEVAEWADGTGVAGLPNVLSTLDGTKLNQLKNLLRRSPDAYYKGVKEELRMTLDQTLGLADALEKL